MIFFFCIHFIRKIYRIILNIKHEKLFKLIIISIKLLNLKIKKNKYDISIIKSVPNNSNFDEKVILI